MNKWVITGGATDWRGSEGCTGVVRGCTPGRHGWCGGIPWAGLYFAVLGRVWVLTSDSLIPALVPLRCRNNGLKFPCFTQKWRQIIEQTNNRVTTCCWVVCGYRGKTKGLHPPPTPPRKKFHYRYKMFHCLIVPSTDL